MRLLRGAKGGEYTYSWPPSLELLARNVTTLTVSDRRTIVATASGLEGVKRVEEWRPRNSISDGVERVDARELVYGGKPVELQNKTTQTPGRRRMQEN
jgi:hypothetical protein